MDDSDANKLTAPAPRASHTYMGDWVWMLDIPDNALRVYQCARAFIFEKDPDSVSVHLTDPEIARLTNRSESTVKRGRKTCYEHGLLWEVSLSTEHLPPKTPGGRPRARTVRTLGVALEPPEGFSGATNCYTELKRIRRESEGSNLTGHTDQGKQDPADVSAGQCEGSNLVEGRSNLVEGRSDLLGITGSDQAEDPSQVSSQVSSQPTNAREQGSSTANGDQVAPGWLEGQQDNEEEDVSSSPAEDTRDQARALLDGLVMPKGEQYQPQRADIGKVAEALDAGVDPERIESEVLSGLEGAERPAAVVGTRCRGLTKLTQSATTHSGSQGSITVLPEWCGECDGQDPAERFVERDGRRAHCECHPNHPSRRPSAPAAPAPAEQADPHGVLAQAGITG